MIIFGFGVVGHCGLHLLFYAHGARPFKREALHSNVGVWKDGELRLGAINHHLYKRGVEVYGVQPILCAFLSADAAYVVGAIGQALAKHHRKVACGPPGAGRDVEGFLADRFLYGVALGIIQAEATVKGVGMAHISAC